MGTSNNGDPTSLSLFMLIHVRTTRKLLMALGMAFQFSFTPEALGT